MKGELIFWGILAGIAAFYLLWGNDVYKEKFKKLEEVAKQQKILEQNITKE